MNLNQKQIIDYLLVKIDNIVINNNIVNYCLILFLLRSRYSEITPCLNNYKMTTFQAFYSRRRENDDSCELLLDPISSEDSKVTVDQTIGNGHTYDENLTQLKAICFLLYLGVFIGKQFKVTLI